MHMPSGARMVRATLWRFLDLQNSCAFHILMKAHWRMKQLLISSVVCRIGYEQETNVSCKMSAIY